MEEFTFIKNKAFINGRWENAARGKSFDVFNPATNEIIATVTDMDREDTSNAIDAASTAWHSFREKTSKERSVLLKKWHFLILQHKEELAKIMTMECGKAIIESKGEVEYGAAFVEWFAEEAKRTYGDVIPAQAADKRLVVIKQSIGVAAAITPWNFPLAMITRKVSPALAAGSPVIIKPADETPLTALALAELAEQAGFPPGVFNVITTTASSEVGRELCENKKVRKLSFTGSTAVGKILYSQSASTLKKLSLELGGNAPFIVFEDADIDAAVKGGIQAKFRNNGQTCVCVNRFLVQDKIYDEFVEKLTKGIRSLKIGNGLDPEVQVGPLINKKGLNKVKDHVEDAIQKGASLIEGGKPLEGLFFEPTVIVNANQDMKLAKEETFGPVASIFRFNSEEEAINLANNTEYGLAAYFYSQNVARCWRVAEKLEYGMVGINEGIISTELAPFGGVKESGIGREGSKYGMDYFMEIKYLCFGNI